MATALGVLVGTSGFWLGLATAGHLLIIAFFFRYSSLASLVAAAFAPVYYPMVDGVVLVCRGTIAASIVVMALLLAWRHRKHPAPDCGHGIAPGQQKGETCRG